MFYRFLVLAILLFQSVAFAESASSQLEQIYSALKRSGQMAPIIPFVDWDASYNSMKSCAVDMSEKSSRQTFEEEYRKHFAPDVLKISIRQQKEGAQKINDPEERKLRLEKIEHAGLLFEKGLTEIHRMLTSLNYKVLSSNEDINFAKVSVELSDIDGDGERNKAVVPLVKVGAEWKLATVRLEDIFGYGKQCNN